MSKEREIELAEHLQKECHVFVERIIAAKGTTDIDFNDATFTWIYLKLASIQNEINEIKIAVNANKKP